jgi:hypothetical protein
MRCGANIRKRYAIVLVVIAIRYFHQTYWIIKFTGCFIITQIPKIPCISVQIYYFRLNIYYESSRIPGKRAIEKI